MSTKEFFYSLILQLSNYATNICIMFPGTVLDTGNIKMKEYLSSRNL